MKIRENENDHKEPGSKWYYNTRTQRWEHVGRKSQWNLHPKDWWKDEPIEEGVVRGARHRRSMYNTHIRCCDDLDNCGSLANIAFGRVNEWHVRRDPKFVRGQRTNRCHRNTSVRNARFRHDIIKENIANTLREIPEYTERFGIARVEVEKQGEIVPGLKKIPDITIHHIEGWIDQTTYVEIWDSHPFDAELSQAYNSKVAVVDLYEWEYDSEVAFEEALRNGDLFRYFLECYDRDNRIKAFRRRQMANTNKQRIERNQRFSNEVKKWASFYEMPEAKISIFDAFEDIEFDYSLEHFLEGQFEMIKSYYDAVEHGVMGFPVENEIPPVNNFQSLQQFVEWKKSIEKEQVAISRFYDETELLVSEWAVIFGEGIRSDSVLISNEIFHFDDFLFKSEFDWKLLCIQVEVDEISQFITQYNELMIDLSPYLIDEGIRNGPVWLSNESFHMDDFLFKSDLESKKATIHDEIEEMGVFLDEFQEIAKDYSPYLIGDAGEHYLTKPLHWADFLSQSDLHHWVNNLDELEQLRVNEGDAYEKLLIDLDEVESAWINHNFRTDERFNINFHDFGDFYCADMFEEYVDLNFRDLIRRLEAYELLDLDISKMMDVIERIFDHVLSRKDYIFLLFKFCSLYRNLQLNHDIDIDLQKETRELFDALYEIHFTSGAPNTQKILNLAYEFGVGKTPLYYESVRINGNFFELKTSLQLARDKHFNLRYFSYHNGDGHLQKINAYFEDYESLYDELLSFLGASAHQLRYILAMPCYPDMSRLIEDGFVPEIQRCRDLVVRIEKFNRLYEKNDFDTQRYLLKEMIGGLSHGTYIESIVKIKSYCYNLTKKGVIPMPFISKKLYYTFNYLITIRKEIECWQSSNFNEAKQNAYAFCRNDQLDMLLKLEESSENPDAFPSSSVSIEFVENLLSLEQDYYDKKYWRSRTIGTRFRKSGRAY